MEIAVESPVRALARPEENDRPIEGPMDRGEFDYAVYIKPMESRIMRSIWRIVRQREAAEDALQDALAVIWKKRREVAHHPNPEAVILRIAVGAAYDTVRKMRRRLRREIPGLPDQAGNGSTAPLSREIEERALRTCILAAIGRLPKRQATAVLLRIVEERPYEEIARSMGCSTTTARIHVMRGRAALSRSLAHLRPELRGT